jgi:hypothetical protein
MKYTYLAKENYSHAATFALGDLCAELSKQRFDVAPLDVGAGRVSEKEFERALMLPLHARMVPKISTFDNDQHGLWFLTANV